MTDGPTEIWLRFASEQNTPITARIMANMPLGVARLGGLTLNSHLSKSRVTEIGYRHCSVVSDAQVDQTRAILAGQADTSGDEGVWAECPCDADGRRFHLLLLTHAQLERVLQFDTTGSFVLPNGQTIRLDPLAAGTGSSTADNHRWYMMQDLDVEHTPGIFQTFPYNMLERDAPRASARVFLHPSHRADFGKNLTLACSDPASVDDDLSPRQLLLAIEYDDAVRPHRVVVHENELRSLNLHAGDLIRLEPTDIRPVFREHNTYLQERRVVGRVACSDDLDVGHPVCRMTEDAMELMGVHSGQEVHLSGGHDLRKKRQAGVTVRVLLDTKPAPDDPGDGRFAVMTLPSVKIDRLRREKLQVTPGDPIFVRPAYFGLLADEMTVAMNAIAIGAAGGLISANLVLFGVAAFLFLVFLLLAFARKFR